MSDQDKQCWPAAKIQRQLRADEALIEIGACAKGVSREPQTAGHSGEIQGRQATDAAWRWRGIQDKREVTIHMKRLIILAGPAPSRVPTGARAAE
jgi:hypothetical protein